ncbi:MULTISPECIES: VacJ family lipoprotein [Methylomonas]|uniref:ABC transporter n=2 Tax=Methylomonas TaxID=416 RepID=A0A126T706_9GAMM|nr:MULTISPECIES: VacJ family lipoprotein [Methylomonas]AMK77861.1 ABC transporter [Methylomonas denitrificans]OAI06763.1 ABC transporter [Methylomonas methanica]TCV87033.1 phospholipid-binding lipoprotein MlaA [Methylomonas methanica]
MYNPSYQGNSQASLLWAVLFSSALSVTGCATTDQHPADATRASKGKADAADPYEGFNRSMYGFNMGLDKHLLKPIANGYKTVTPNFMQTGVSNFFTNLKGINVVLNDFLQGKFEQGASDTGRFLTNSTVGLLGLFDVASDLGLQGNVEDFGQTLAVWGVDQGPYLVLPVLGPTTVRDGAAIVVDKAANPGTYVPGTGIVEGINDRANAEGALNFIDEAALDPYVFTRESFLQYRKNLINDGKSNSTDYDLDIDADVDVGEISSAKPKESNATQKPKADAAKKQPGHVQNAIEVTPGSAKPNSATFDSMSKSFDNAALEFEKASDKMDLFSKKKRQRKHR